MFTGVLFVVAGMLVIGWLDLAAASVALVAAALMSWALQRRTAPAEDQEEPDE